MKALYAGWCIVCEGEIQVGSAIEAAPSGEWVHARHTHGSTCPKCFMTYTPAGTCGCDE